MHMTTGGQALRANDSAAGWALDIGAKAICGHVLQSKGVESLQALRGLSPTEMRVSTSIFVFLLLGGLSVSGAGQTPVTPSAASQKHAAKKKTPAKEMAKSQDLPAPSVSAEPYGPPEPPPKPPLRPEQMPPSAPKVTLQNGLLSVEASNATMSSVVNAIRARTGIAFEGLSGGGERVAISLGPASEGDVLSRLFQGSRFDYVIVARPDDPSQVQRVILTARQSPAALAAQNAAAPQQQNQQAEEDQDTGDTAEETQQPQVPTMPAPTAEINAAQPAQQQQQQPQGADQQPANANAPKTPEELLQELQQMRQRQQQQQQNGQPPGVRPPL